MSAPTANFALRPLEVKHLFDFMIRLYRANFTPMFLALALVQLPLSLLSLPMMFKLLEFTGELTQMQNTGAVPDSTFLLEHFDAAVWILATALLAMAYQLLVMPLGNLSCAKLAIAALHGSKLTLGEALRFSLSRYWPTQIALAVFYLPLVVLSLLVLVPVLAAQAGGDPTAIIGAALFGLLVILLGSLGLLLAYFRFYPALSGIVQAAEEPEGRGATAQAMYYLRRCWELSKGYYMRLLGLLLLVWFAFHMVNQGITDTIRLIVMLVQSLLTGGDAAGQLVSQLMTQQDPVSLAVTMVLSSMVLLLFPPLQMCYKVLLYVDLRCRKEGYDLKRVLGLADET